MTGEYATILWLVIWVVFGVGLTWGFFVAGWLSFIYSFMEEEILPFVLGIVAWGACLGWSALWIYQAVVHVITLVNR